MESNYSKCIGLVVASHNYRWITKFYSTKLFRSYFEPTPIDEYSQEVKHHDPPTIPKQGAAHGRRCTLIRSKVNQRDNTLSTAMFLNHIERIALFTTTKLASPLFRPKKHEILKLRSSVNVYVFNEMDFLLTLNV